MSEPRTVRFADGVWMAHDPTTDVRGYGETKEQAVEKMRQANALNEPPSIQDAAKRWLAFARLTKNPNVINREALALAEAVARRVAEYDVDHEPTQHAPRAYGDMAAQPTSWCCSYHCALDEVARALGVERA